MQRFNLIVLTALTALAVLPLPVPAPIAPCSPFRFINGIVESPALAWLLRDLPGHPQRPCPYANPWDAPLEERSTVYFFKSRPERIFREIALESEFALNKALPRLMRHLAGKAALASSLFPGDPEPNNPFRPTIVV